MWLRQDTLVRLQNMIYELMSYMSDDNSVEYNDALLNTRLSIAELIKFSQTRESSEVLARFIRENSQNNPLHLFENLL